MTPRGHVIHVYTNGLNKIIRCEVNCKLPWQVRIIDCYWELEGKKRTFMDRFFCFLLRTKSVLRLKNRSRTGKTDDFSSPDCDQDRWWHPIPQPWIHSAEVQGERRYENGNTTTTQQPRQVWRWTCSTYSSSPNFRNCCHFPLQWW